MQIKLTFTEVDLLDGSNTSISFNDFNTLHCLRGNLGDEVVGIKDKGLEQLGWWDDGGELGFVCEHTHDDD